MSPRIPPPVHPLRLSLTAVTKAGRVAVGLLLLSHTPLWAQPHDDGPALLVEQVINYQGAELAQQRQRFVAAEKALRLRRVTQYRRLLPGLETYPLYPYLQYQDIKRRLSRASAQELKYFLSQYDTLPVAAQLRQKLLRLLARQGRWQQYLDFYRPTANVRLQCHYLYALLRTGQKQAVYPQIEKRWLSGQSQPRNCDRVFKSWQADGKLTTELVWRRMDLALSSGHRTLARYLVRSLPAKEQALARLWITLHRKPQLLGHYQQRLERSDHPMAGRLFINVMTRLARRDPQAAAERWMGSSRARQSSKQEQYALLQEIAMAMATRQLPGAEAWFSLIPPDKLSDSAREWRVRAALRQGQWANALAALNALTPSQQANDRWRFWQARVNEELGKTKYAQIQFRNLAQRRSFYGFLAADRLNLPYAISGCPHHTSAGTLFEIGQQPAVRRAREFLQLGRLVEARREWRTATKNMNNDQRVDAAKLAQHWGWAEQSILTMAGTDQRDDLQLRFPLLYQKEVLDYSQRADINPAWTYGVIRRESAFVVDARSPKGALGLMQLMPATAKSLSRFLPRKYRGRSKLTQPAANLALGTHYLRKMLKRFGGQTVLATAAYNAGAQRIKGWLPKEASLDAERWIENIPYRETRDYVTSVLAFTVIYADRLGLEPVRLSQHMTSVPRRETL